MMRAVQFDITIGAFQLTGSNRQVWWLFMVSLLAAPVTDGHYKRHWLDAIKPGSAIMAVVQPVATCSGACCTQYYTALGGDASNAAEQMCTNASRLSSSPQLQSAAVLTQINWPSNVREENPTWQDVCVDVQL